VKLQERIIGASPTLPFRIVPDLFEAMLKRLAKAMRDDVLTISPKELREYVKMSERESKLGTYQIVGGLKAFRREPDMAQLKRSDGAWIHFSLTARSQAQAVEMLAYDFEIVFPAGHSPVFLRFDLNEQGHRNEGREIRSHLHPGNDDLLVPAPVMTPLELLTLFLDDLRPRDVAKPRA
jgi:hypothetical protein